uniref:Major facilitator superfamily (MFS) profile domain-containing protein n=1 Tax=Eptatretus burgeri TaxID=7764 RepID=A0A8C4Q627_EPTBU
MRMRCAQVLVFTTISLVAVFGSALPTALYPFFPQEAALKGTSRGVVGLIYGLHALSQLFICPVLSKMVTHVPAKVIFIAGIALTGICTILFGLGGRISSQTLFILVCIITHSLSGIGAAASDIMAVIFINTTFPNITTMLGILEVFCSVGVLLGPPLGGALYERFQYEPPFLILGSLYLILIPFSMLTLPNQGESQEVQPGGYKHFLQRKSVLVMSLQVCISSVAMTFIRPIMPPFLTHQVSQIHFNCYP